MDAESVEPALSGLAALEPTHGADAHPRGLDLALHEVGVREVSAVVQVLLQPATPSPQHPLAPSRYAGSPSVQCVGPRSGLLHRLFEHAFGLPRREPHACLHVHDFPVPAVQFAHTHVHFVCEPATSQAQSQPVENLSHSLPEALDPAPYRVRARVPVHVVALEVPRDLVRRQPLEVQIDRLGDHALGIVEP